jgi:hypothetical protein
MSKTFITRLFAAAVAAVVAGFVISVAAIVVALADGAIAFGGPQIVTFNGGAFVGPVVALIVASVVVSAGTLAALVAWIGALRNTYQLDDKTWFVALLVLGLCSLGWVAMIAYVFAGPDGSEHGPALPGPAMSAQG